MSKANVIGLFVLVVLAAVIVGPPVVAQAKAADLEMKDGKARVESQLTKEDALDVKGRKLSFSKAYSVKFDLGVYRIDALSKAFDTYLRLEDDKGTHVAADDDGGDASNARIVYRVGKAGTFRIVVTSFDPGRVGAFTLAVARIEADKNRLVLKDDKASVDATLTREDPFDKVRDKSRCKIYTLDMKAGKTYRIDLESRSFDCFLRLEDPDGKRLQEDDDGGQGTNSRITYRCAKAGTYRIIATHLDPDVFGAFTLKVGESGAGRLALVDGRAVVEGDLTKEDDKDRVRNTPCKVYLVEMEADRSYRIDHQSNVFDAFLRLEDSDGKELASNDDGGDGTNARITYRPTKTATYRVIPTTLNSERVGTFTLSILRADAPKQGKLVLKGNRAEFDGILTRDDPFDKVRAKSRCHVFALDMQAGTSYRIDLMSKAFDCFLRLENSDGQQLADNDDGGDGTNSRIVFRPTKAGTYRIIATHLNPDFLGAYTLSVIQSSAGGRLTLRDGRATADGELTKEDEKDRVRNYPCKVYLVEMEADKTYKIDHASRTFDCYLRLEDPDGKEVAANDDGGEGTNSRINYRCTKAGVYRISATSLSGSTGAFTLTVAEVQTVRAIKLPIQDGKGSVAAALTKDDAKDPGRPGNVPMKLYAVELEAGRTYQLDLTSKAFDAVMRLEGSDGKAIATDDDSGGDRNSRITFRCLKAGTYQVVATALTANIGQGNFTLTVQQGARVPEVALKEGQGKIESTLSRDDARDYGSLSAMPSRAYAVKMEVGEVYHIDLSSRRFDSYLRFKGPDGKTVAENDDSGTESLDARIEFRCTTAGTYYVIAKPASFTGKYGAFTLTVQQKR